MGVLGSLPRGRVVDRLTRTPVNYMTIDDAVRRYITNNMVRYDEDVRTEL